MPPVDHLKSLQALEMALRAGSLKAAAARLRITPAAVGQRIRMLEDHLGTPLLLRDRSGLQPTPGLTAAQDDLAAAFAALERASDALDFQRISEIHIVADPDWAELWLLPRIAGFRAKYPRVLFCINGAGDAPVRLGAPDVRVFCGDGAGEALFHDFFLPVTGPDNPRRMAGGNPAMQMEGMPLLHLRAQRDDDTVPGWVSWFRHFGQREKGTDRGVTYPNMRLALPALRLNVGFLVCGLSFVLPDLVAGTLVRPFPAALGIPAPHPYRMALRPDAGSRPQLQRFLAWLRGEADETARQIGAWSAPADR